MKIAISLMTLMLFGLSYAQKKNVQNAAMDYSSYEKAISSKNLEGAKKHINSAKTNIDAAASNAETAEDPKMYFYKGQIYFGLAALAKMMPEDAEMNSLDLNAIFETGVSSWKNCYAKDTKGRHKDDINNQVMFLAIQSSNMGGQLYGEKKYAEAYDLFSSAVKLYDIIGKMDKDYGATAFNAGLSAEQMEKYDDAFKYFSMSSKAGFEPASSAARAASVLYSSGKKDEAMAYVIKASEEFPGDGTLIVTMADLALKTGKDDIAIESLNKAIQKDPSNAVYHWALGTVYERVGKEQEAINAFTKASELDPKDDRPFYSLGSYYFNKAVNIMDEANKLKLGDAQFEVLEKQALAEFEKSVPFLEKVVEINGDAKSEEIMNNLFTVYRKIGQSAKAMDMKRRIEALKQ